MSTRPPDAQHPKLRCGVLNEKVARETPATTGLVQTTNARDYVQHDQSSKRSTIEQT